jgi:hypothetical protein
VDALALLSDTRIRSLALELAAAGRPALRSEVPDLLDRNWADGDERLLESMLATTTGRLELDRLVAGVLDVNGSHPEADLVPSLLLAYERGPCAFCRRYVVKALIERTALPEALRDECRYDVVDETRELVRAPSA